MVIHNLSLYKLYQKLVPPTKWRQGVKAKSGIMEIVKGWSGIGCRCWIVAKSFIEITSILYSIKKLFKVWKGKYQQKALIQWAFVEGRLEENEFLGLNGSKKSWLLPSLYFIHYSLFVTVPLWALNKVISNMKLNYSSHIQNRNVYCCISSNPGIGTGICLIKK